MARPEVGLLKLDGSRFLGGPLEDRLPLARADEPAAAAPARLAARELFPGQALVVGPPPAQLDGRRLAAPARPKDEGADFGLDDEVDHHAIGPLGVRERGECLPAVVASAATGIATAVPHAGRNGGVEPALSYARMLWPFFRVTTPDRVRSSDVLAYAHGIGASGRVPSSTTVGARIACLSSFYRFTIRMGLLTANPCDALERPRTVPSAARGYSADEVRRLLAVVPDTVRGRRDRAILLVLVLTGRRRAEVIGLTAGDLSLEGETVFYSYRGKGGKRGRRELPRPAYAAILRTLADAGKELATMDPEVSLWQAGAGPSGISSGTFYGRFRRYLAAAGLTPTGLLPIPLSQPTTTSCGRNRPKARNDATGSVVLKQGDRHQLTSPASLPLRMM